MSERPIDEAGSERVRSERQALASKVEREARRTERAEKERTTLLAQTVFLGTLGVILVLPIVGGAYLGRWLDGFAGDYSVRWTVGFIFLGTVIGAVNVYLLIRG